MSDAEKFVIFQGQQEGRPLIAVVDERLRDFRDRNTLPFFLSIGTRLVTVTPSGLPTREEAEDLNRWEEAIEKRFRPQGSFVFVGRVTWNGERELLYYVDNPEPFLGALKFLSAARSTRPFAFATERDDNWNKADFWLNRR